jgi:hypothetical protein
MHGRYMGNKYTVLVKKREGRDNSKELHVGGGGDIKMEI